MKIPRTRPDQGSEALLGEAMGLPVASDGFHSQNFAQGEIEIKREFRTEQKAHVNVANYTPDIRFGGPGMLGARLRQWRKSNDYTLDAVAAAIGTSAGHISDMERNKRPVSSRWIERIAAAYGVPQSEIIGTEEPQPAADALQEEERQAVLAEYLELTDEARANIRSVMRQMPKRPESGS